MSPFLGYVARMSDLQKVTNAKKKAEKSAYRQGMEEGWKDAMWLVMLISAVVAVVASLP